jgi:type VI protein secretion system component Hcp
MVFVSQPKFEMYQHENNIITYHCKQVIVQSALSSSLEIHPMSLNYISNKLTPLLLQDRTHSSIWNIEDASKFQLARMNDHPSFL